eukprot:11859175-Ditylum_brightwellii.AAC.1
MTSDERDVVTELMISGFDDQCNIADAAVVGDVLVLTKLLGTQVEINVRQWHCDSHKNGEA